jgi:hypothetical protein
MVVENLDESIEVDNGLFEIFAFGNPRCSVGGDYSVVTMTSRPLASFDHAASTVCRYLAIPVATDFHGTIRHVVFAATYRFLALRSSSCFPRIANGLVRPYVPGDASTAQVVFVAIPVTDTLLSQRKPRKIWKV